MSSSRELRNFSTVTETKEILKTQTSKYVCDLFCMSSAVLAQILQQLPSLLEPAAQPKSEPMLRSTMQNW
jgi:hypothetical protein